MNLNPLPPAARGSARASPILTAEMVATIVIFRRELSAHEDARHFKRARRLPRLTGAALWEPASAVLPERAHAGKLL